MKEHVSLNMWGYSSVVEHLTADQEVPGSNPGAPSGFGRLGISSCLFVLILYGRDNLGAPFGLVLFGGFEL